MKGILFACVQILGRYSHNWARLATLQEDVLRLEKLGFMLKKEKRTFLAEPLVYLGLKTDKIGLHPLECTINTKTHTKVRLSHYRVDSTLVYRPHLPVQSVYKSVLNPTETASKRTKVVRARKKAI